MAGFVAISQFSEPFRRKDLNVKTAVIALSAVALMAISPRVFAQNQNLSNKTLERQHRTVPGHLRWHAVHSKSAKIGYPRAFGYAPDEPKDYTLENGRQAGGGGGGGGGM